MSKLTREYKSELLKLAIRAHKGKSTKITLCGRHIELHTLVHHINTGLVTGCEIYYGTHDFHNRTASIWDCSEYRAHNQRVESIARD